MTWTERVKLAFTTFKRAALPLYGWTLIFLQQAPIHLDYLNEAKAHLTNTVAF